MTRASLRVVALVGLLAFTACGRDRYELTAGRNGWVYRIDKQTGEVIVIDGSGSYRVMSPEETARAEAAEKPGEEGQKDAFDDFFTSE